MKHIVKPRRYGKSTALIREALKEKEAIIVVPRGSWIRMMVNLTKEILNKQKKSFKHRISTNEILTKNKKLRFVSFRTFISEPSPSTPVFIDEAGIILKELFGNVVCISSTGPNKKTNKKLHKTIKNIYKKVNVSKETLLNEFTLDW